MIRWNFIIRLDGEFMGGLMEETHAVRYCLILLSLAPDSSNLTINGVRVLRPPEDMKLTSMLLWWQLEYSVTEEADGKT
jgi:hypothetical protein